MSALAWIALAAAGGLGALARFLLDAAISERASGAFPLGTLAVNLSGSFALGVLAGAAVAGGAMFVAGTGALGAYTTLSTWMLESQRLVEDGQDRPAALNVAGSLAAGLAAAALGHAIGAAL